MDYQSAVQRATPPASVLAGSFDVACGVNVNTTFTTTSSSPQIVSQCTFTAPADGFVFISADASVALTGADSEAHFQLGLDSTVGDGGTGRWVNVYTNANDGTDKSVAVSILKPVTAGAHTFYLLASRYAGTGTVLLYDSALTVELIGADPPVQQGAVTRRVHGTAGPFDRPL